VPQLVVPPSSAGARLDRWLASTISEVSRARLQSVIVSGGVRVNGAATKPSHRLRGGEVVDLEIPSRPPEELVPEPIALSVVYEDAHVLVVDKPAGMVVHPGAGLTAGTLAAAALAHAPVIAGVGGPRRPGIVHRLDKGTSGLLVIAKTQAAYDSLVSQLARRAVERGYLAIVHGRISRASGTVDTPIGRDPTRRQRMAVRPAGKGKRAVTHWEVVERFRDHTVLALRLETGRTHQIRVHLAASGHPIVGDTTYARRAQTPIDGGGLALHAAQLAFVHPVAQKRMQFSAALPPRLDRLLSHLRDGG
jgi:23S rRNA pseudouridine1911/1915/1917 synthase